MTQQLINIGTADQGNGDPLRTAFNKVNANFTELYTALGLVADVDLNLGAFEFNDSVMTTNDSTAITIDQQVNITSDLVMSGNVVPATTNIHDLGSLEKQWRSLYLTGNTVYFNGVPLSVTDDGTILVNGEVAATPGGSATWDSVTNKPSMFDIGGNVIGIASSTTISEETPGGTISETTEIESQIEIENTGIVIAKRTRIIVDDAVTTSTDEAGSTLTVNNSTASIKHYVEPDGPNNGSYFQVSTSNVGAVLEGVNETLNGTDYGRVLAVQNAVTIGTSVEGVAKYWLFDYLGGLTLPTPTSQVFTLTFDSTHYTPTVGKPSLELTSEPWQLEGQVIYEQNGTASLQLTNIWPTVVNPGYDSGDTFTFSTLVHGLSDYTLTITLNDVVLAGPAGWTADVAVSQLPAYPSSILANGAIKLTADTQSWVFGADGQLTVPGAIFKDGGLYMNSSGSTTAASVFVSGFSGSVILRTADNANNVSHDLIFDVNGNLTLPGNVSYPGGITQSRQDDTVCNAGVDTVVYTSTGEFQHAIKLFVMVEGMAPGGDGVNWDTQACDVIAVKGFANNIVHVTTYGVTYTSAAAFATFDGQWNATTNRIEITCRPVSVTNGVTVSVHAIEMLSNN